ncbi:MAG: transporter substrate-binding domain-containing protein, partial [Minisyncoccales bacterium]
MIRIPVFLLLGALALFSSVAAARSIEEIKQSGELKVAIRDNLPPMEFMDNGKLVGIDPELAEMLAQSLGVKPTWVFFKETKEREALLSEQKVDVVVSAYSVTEKRMELVNFSESYFDSGSAILIRRADRDKIKGHKDLAGKNVATLKGSVSATTMENFIASAIPSLVSSTIEDGYKMLKEGKADAVLYDKPMLDFVAAKDDALLVVDETPLDPSPYAIGVSLQDIELLGHVNQFLKGVKDDGKLTGLLQKYSTASIPLVSV